MSDLATEIRVYKSDYVSRIYKLADISKNMTQKIQYYKYLSDNFLEEFKNYNKIMENYLFLNYRKSNMYFEEDNKIGSMNDQELIKFSQTFFEESIFYPQSFRTSFFIQIFSVLEHELKEICLIHFQQNKYIFSIADLKGNSDIEKAKLYLKKAGNINFDDFEPEWSYLETMRKIRNRFVHSQGEINQKHPDWNKIYSFVSSNENSLGLSNCAECLEKSEFYRLYDIDSTLTLEIQGHDFNDKMILSVKKFLNMLANKLTN